MPNKKNNTLNKVSMIIVLIILVVLVCTVISFYNTKKENDKLLSKTEIYNNVYIDSVNVSNMTKESAISALENISLNEKITLIYENTQLIFNKSEFGVSLDKQSAVDRAYEIGRIGTDKERLEEINSFKDTSYFIEIEKKIDEEVARNKLEEICKDLGKEPVNAKLEKNGNTFTVIEGSNGLKADIEATYINLINSIKSAGDTTANIVMVEVEEQYPAEELNKIQDTLGAFYTNYTNTGVSDTNRIINMKVAASRINGVVLYPGEVFSTNEKFGESTKANGYMPAPTILNGKLVDDYGGGVCQVSSTLYNAVLYSELEVVERQNHSLKVGYLDYGYDATLAGDYIDFKFKNSTNYPIYIESYLTDNKVVCNIYGYDERPDNREIKFENTLVDVIEPGPAVITETEQLLEGETKTEVTALKGYKYNLYKLIYVDGVLSEKILINNSYYKPRAEQVLVGTKKSVQVINNQDDSIYNEQTSQSVSDITTTEQETADEQTTSETTTIESTENLVE